MEIKTIQAGTAALQNYFDQWAALDRRHENVRQNIDLSEAGKRKAYQSIEQARAGLRDEALAGFTAEYARQRQAHSTNDKARGKALEQGLARWEPLRNAIELETERVTRLVNNGAAESDLVRDWKDNKDSGALVIAWRRALGSFPNMTKTGLFADVNRTYEEVRNTPQLQQVNTRASELADATLALREDTYKFIGLVSKHEDLDGVALKLQRLSQQIKTTSIGNGRLYVEFVDSPFDEMRQLAQPEVFTS